MQYWLMKSEPSECSIDKLSSLPNQTIEWFGVRNYQARNFMKNDMQKGDLAMFWHSSCKDPGIYGIVKILNKSHPDSTQFDINSKYYDAKSTMDKSIWWCVDVKLVNKVHPIAINTLRLYPELANMQVLRRGNRLSITKISQFEWNIINTLIHQIR